MIDIAIMWALIGVAALPVVFPYRPSWSGGRAASRDRMGRLWAEHDAAYPPDDCRCQGRCIMADRPLRERKVAS